jgi:hypothetical protein
MERFSHRPDNLLVQSMGLTNCLFKPRGLTTCFFSPSPKLILVRVMETINLGMEQLMATIHAQSGNFIGSNSKTVKEQYELGKV